MEEVTLNSDDPNWNMRVGKLTELIYEQMAEQEKDEKNYRHKKRCGEHQYPEHLEFVYYTILFRDHWQTP